MIAICLVGPTVLPFDTKKLANQLVPVVPIFAPRIAAMAEVKGRKPLATSPTIAVVLKELDCHYKVQSIPPTNIQ